MGIFRDGIDCPRLPKLLLRSQLRNISLELRNVSTLALAATLLILPDALEVLRLSLISNSGRTDGMYGQTFVLVAVCGGVMAINVSCMQKEGGVATGNKLQHAACRVPGLSEARSVLLTIIYCIDYK